MASLNITPMAATNFDVASALDIDTTSMLQAHSNSTSILHSDGTSVPHSNATPAALLIFKATATGVILIISIFANSLTLIVLRQIPDLNPVTRIFMTTMTLSDLGCGFGYILPILAATIVNKWPFGDVFCVILGFVNIVFSFTSFISLLSVNFERFLAVTRPLQYPNLMNVKRARVISFGVWCCAFSIAGLNCFQPGRTIYYSSVMHACTTGPEDPTVRDVKGTVFILLFAIVPFGLICGFFLRLFLLARFHATRIAAQGIAVGKKSDRKAFTTFSIMTICFTVGLSPLIAVFVYENMTRKEPSLWLVCFAQLLAFSNSISNVVVYYLRNRAFKQTAWRLISRILCFKGTRDTFETSLIPLSSSSM